ncbi:MAG: hypothetical protein AB7I38_02640 [Dehalococcoidia bacterium]
MPIDGGMRDKLEPGTVLVARYRGAEHRAEVFRDEEGKTRYRLQDGREFKSPSSAGSAVMGGVACNGWRFWSLQGDEPAGDPPKPVKASKPRKPKAAVETTDAATSEPVAEEVTAG